MERITKHVEKEYSLPSNEQAKLSSGINRVQIIIRIVKRVVDSFLEMFISHIHFISSCSSLGLQESLQQSSFFIICSRVLELTLM
jgi:hypothetical protein